MPKVSDIDMDTSIYVHTPSRLLNIQLVGDDHIVVTESLPIPIHIGVSYTCILIMVIDAQYMPNCSICVATRHDGTLDSNIAFLRLLQTKPRRSLQLNYMVCILYMV